MSAAFNFPGSLLPKSQLPGLTASSCPPLPLEVPPCLLFWLSAGTLSVLICSKGGSPPSHAYNYKLLDAAEFPAHISSPDLSLELQVHTLASYSLFLLGCSVPILKLIFLKWNTTEPAPLAASPTPILPQVKYPGFCYFSLIHFYFFRKCAFKL